MRICAGTYKGRKLICPPGVIRPAMDRMRESMFAILGDIRGCSFLDLYCGSGSVGIEAASRGADPVVFVEKDRGKRAVLERNLSFVRESIQLFMLPVEHFLRRTKDHYDLVFLDPPFRQRGKLEVLQLIAERSIVAPGGILLIHLSKEELKQFPEALVAGEKPQLRQHDSRVYGGSLLLFYRASACSSQD